MHLSLIIIKNLLSGFVGDSLPGISIAIIKIGPFGRNSRT